MSGAFCKNLLCKRQERKNKCCGCGKYLCGMCTIENSKGNEYCINCYLNPNIDWLKINTEFDNMIYDLKKKKEVEVKTHA